MNEESFHLMDLLPCGYLITSADGVISYANKFMIDLLKVPKLEYILNKNLEDFLQLGVKVYFNINLKSLLKTSGNLSEASLEIQTQDGLTIPVLVNAKVVCDDFESIKTIHYTFFDNSERKKAESALLLASHKQEILINQLTTSNKKYQLLTKQLEENKNYYKKQTEIHQHISQVGRVGSWEIDLVKGLLVWSLVTQQIHEVDSQTQPNLQEAINFFSEGESRTNITNIVLNTIKTRIPFDEEMQIVTAKGNEIWVRVLGFAERINDTAVTINPAYAHLKVENNEAQTTRLYGTYQDIDKQKKMMLLLQQSNINIEKDNSYLKSVVENNSFYIVKTNLAGAYTYFNPYFIEMMGIKPDDYIGTSSMSLIIPSDHHLCLDVVDKCFKEPHKSHWVILRKPSHKGVITNNWEFRLLKDENGNFTEFLCIGHEISTLINKQDELKKLLDITSIQNTKLQNFTYIISHNIRSHVANLFGIISITDLENTEERETAWSLIKSTVTSLNETIFNIEQIVRLQSEKLLPVKCINIYDEINTLLPVLKVLIETSQTKISYNFDCTTTLNTNATYFESIILNLITNSIKYKLANQNPHIQIGVYNDLGFKVITFKDNGLGIDLKKHGHKIFGMYNTFHTHQDAKGLGLFIIKTQIEAMGGKIEIESKEGEGTTFKVYFLEN